jgi:hypothetical protein
VIIEQADMWDLDGKAPSHIAGYQFVDSIAQHTAAFGRPVLLFNGDSHTYRSDNPLSPSAPCTWQLATPCVSVAANQPGGYDLPNFHRVVVHGSTFPLEWLKVTVDPAADNPAGPNAVGPSPGSACSSPELMPDQPRPHPHCARVRAWRAQSATPPSSSIVRLRLRTGGVAMLWSSGRPSSDARQ